MVCRPADLKTFRPENPNFQTSLKKPEKTKTVYSGCRSENFKMWVSSGLFSPVRLLFWTSPICFFTSVRFTQVVSRRLPLGQFPVSSCLFPRTDPHFEKSRPFHPMDSGQTPQAVPWGPKESTHGRGTHGKWLWCTGGWGGCMVGLPDREDGPLRTVWWSFLPFQFGWCGESKKEATNSKQALVTLANSKGQDPPH